MRSAANRDHLRALARAWHDRATAAIPASVVAPATAAPVAGAAIADTTAAAASSSSGSAREDGAWLAGSSKTSSKKRKAAAGGSDAQRGPSPALAAVPSLPARGAGVAGKAEVAGKGMSGKKRKQEEAVATATAPSPVPNVPPARLPAAKASKAKQPSANTLEGGTLRGSDATVVVVDKPTAAPAMVAPAAVATGGLHGRPPTSSGGASRSQPSDLWARACAFAYEVRWRSALPAELIGKAGLRKGRLRTSCAAYLPLLFSISLFESAPGSKSFAYYATATVAFVIDKVGVD